MDNNRDIDNKRQWTKPQLIVLVRSTPAESVLLTCKIIGYFFPGPADSGFNACYYEPGRGCAPCADLVKS